MPIEKPIAACAFGASRHTHRGRVSVACGCLAWSWLTLGYAGDAGSKAEARTHFDRGLLLLDAGDLDAAAAEFEAAHALVPAALAAYDAALAHARLNRPLPAVRLLRDASERSPSAALRDKISVLLHEQEARLGKLLVQVTGTDGKPIADAELHAAGYTREQLRVGQVAEVAPGSITLRIVAAGHAPIERTLRVEAGTRQELAMVLEPSEILPAPAPPAAPPKTAVVREASAEPARDAAASKQEPASEQALPTAGIVTAGVGAALMAASVAVLWDADRGFVQLGPEVDAFNASTSPGAHCSRGNHVSECRSRSEELNQRHADLNRERMFGFVGLGVGAAAAVTGVVWCLSARSAQKTSATRQPLEVVVAPGLSSLLLTGSF
jgi:hypothetical protein